MVVYPMGLIATARYETLPEAGARYEGTLEAAGSILLSGITGRNVSGRSLWPTSPCYPHDGYR